MLRVVLHPVHNIWYYLQCIFLFYCIVLTVFLFFVHLCTAGYMCFFKVCNSVHHRTIQINHQPDATIFQFIILTFIYSWTCFGRFPAHHKELNDCSGSLWFYLHIVVTVVLCLWSGWPAGPTSQMTAVAASGFTFVSWWQSCCVCGQAGRPHHEHSTTITMIRR